MLPELLRNLFTFSDIVFTGLKVIIPLVFLFTLTGVERLKPHHANVVHSLNILLLGAGSLFCMAFLVDMLTCNPFERELRLELISGSNWYRMALPIIGYAILPQLLWKKKWRGSFASSILIVIYWYAVYLFVQYSIKGWEFDLVRIIDWIVVLKHTVITSVIWMLIFWFRKRWILPKA